MLKLQALCASVVVALVSLKSVIAWGDLGHETVGYIAMSVCRLILHHLLLVLSDAVLSQFLAPKALSFVQSTISDSDDNSLGPAATVRNENLFVFIVNTD